MSGKRTGLLAAAVVIVLLAFQTYVLEPRSEEMREEIQTRSATLEKYETYLAGAAITDSDLKAVSEEMKTVEKRLMAEPSDFLASARMQREVSELTAKSGLNIQTIRPLNTLKMKGFIAAPVYFEGSGTIKQISEFLKSIESSPLILKMDKLSVNVTNMQNTRELRFKMQISGLGRV